MNKTIKRYERLLRYLGMANLMLMISSISSLLVFSFPEYQGLVLVWNAFGSVIPVLVISYFALRKGRENVWRVLILSFASLSVLWARGSVARVAWALSISIFTFPSLFAPRPDGRLLMTQPKVWDALVFVVLYGIGSISGNSSLMAMGIIYIYGFLVLWVFSVNIKNCLKRIREEKGDVEVDSILRENRRYMILFVLLFSLLSLLIPLALDRVERERVESSVYYEFGEEKEDENTVPTVVARDKGISREGAPFDLRAIGNILMWLFVSSCIIVLLLEIAALIWRIMGIEERKSNHKDEFEREFIVETIEEEVSKTKGRLTTSSSYNGNIRRLYKKVVEKRAKGLDISSLTATEIDKEILSFDSPLFTSIYEKTRYGGEEIRQEDYEDMKTALKREKKSSKWSWSHT